MIKKSHGRTLQTRVEHLANCTVVLRIQLHWCLLRHRINKGKHNIPLCTQDIRVPIAWEFSIISLCRKRNRTLTNPMNKNYRPLDKRTRLCCLRYLYIFPSLALNLPSTCYFFSSFFSVFKNILRLFLYPVFTKSYTEIFFKLLVSLSKPNYLSVKYNLIGV